MEYRVVARDPHTKEIYSRFNMPSRMEAMRKARGLAQTFRHSGDVEVYIEPSRKRRAKRRTRHAASR